MFKRIGGLIFFAFAFSIALAVPVFAQGEPVIPEYNPLCWHKADCIAQRAILDAGASPEALAKGWIENSGDCKGQDWGKCLPAGQTKTSIAFGGRTQFEHIGDFIGSMYKYAIGIAGIVSVLVIIVSGFQWALSGGNSETITHSKGRIAGALVGLLIAYLSYFILSTLNPDLVSFRLPNVWMVKPQAYAPTFCSQTAPSTKFAFAKDFKDQKSPVKQDEKTQFDLSLEDKKQANLEKFYCGHRFFIQNAGAATCFGDYCGGPGTVCVGFGGKDPANPYNCIKGTVSGKVTYISPLRDPGCLNPLFNGWSYPKMIDVSEEELWWVNENGTSGEIGGTARGQTFGDYQEYVLAVSPEEIKKAKDTFSKNSPLKGYVIKFEMNKSCNINITDQDHWIGYDGKKAVDLGTNSFFRNDLNRAKIDKKYLITEEMLAKGLELNIEASYIHHSSEGFNYEQYFK